MQTPPRSVTDDSTGWMAAGIEGVGSVPWRGFLFVLPEQLGTYIYQYAFWKRS